MTPQSQLSLGRSLGIVLLDSYGDVSNHLDSFSFNQNRQAA